MHCLLILPLICSYMRDLFSQTHIWCISGFILKIGYYNKLEKGTHSELKPEPYSPHGCMSCPSFCQGISPYGGSRSIQQKPEFFPPFIFKLLESLFYCLLYIQIFMLQDHGLIIKH